MTQCSNLLCEAPGKYDTILNVMSLQCAITVLVLLTACSAAHGARDANHLEGGLDASSDGAADRVDADAGFAVDADNDAGRLPLVPQPAPPWHAPPGIEVEPGWRDSAIPACPSYSGRPESGGIFADERGVFVLFNVENNPLLITPDGQWPSGANLMFNNGTGWVEWFQGPGGTAFTPAPRHLAMASLGSPRLWWDVCALRRVESPRLHPCEWEGPVAVGEILRAVHFPTPEIGWAVTDLGVYKILDTGVERFVDAGVEFGFSELIFGGTSSVIVAQGDVLLIASPGAFSLRAIPESQGVPYTSVAGRSLEDVWFGRADGTLRHYDGFAFADLDTGIPDAITQVTLVGSELYYASQKQIGRLNALGDPETLFDWSGTDLSISGLASDSTTLYATVTDRRFVPYLCGATFVLWLDGDRFRRF